MSLFLSRGLEVPVSPDLWRADALVASTMVGEIGALYRGCSEDTDRVRLTSRHGWSAALCGQALIHPREPQSRTASHQYFCDAMLLRTTPMLDPALRSRPNTAGGFSVTVRNCCVIYTQAFQEVGRGWLGNGKPQPRSSDWSPRPATKPLRASPNAAAPILVLSPWSVSSPGRPRAISSNRRRPDYRVTASPSKEARA